MGYKALPATVEAIFCIDISGLTSTFRGQTPYQEMNPGLAYRSPQNCRGGLTGPLAESIYDNRR